MHVHRVCLRRQELKPNTVFIFADTTDAGSDQAARRRQTLAALSKAGLNNVFFLDCNCVLHQFHICVKEQLELTDKFLAEAQSAFPGTLKNFNKYYASLAKAINYWRENVADFIDLYEQMHGTAAPEGVNYRQYPLRMVSGRWGSVHAAEAFFLDRKKSFLQPVWLALLSRRMKADQKQTETETSTDQARAASLAGRGSAKPKAKAIGKKKTGTVAALLDEDSSQAYRIRMSKWASGAFSAISCDVFWVLLRCVHTARAPLTHFFAWAQQNSQDNLLLKLVTGKGQQILKEYANLALNIDTWFAGALSEMDATNLPPQLQALLKSLVFKLLINAAANFNMRIVAMTQR